jgi:hypothetical protein
MIKFSTGQHEAAIAMAIQNSNACHKENETPSYKVPSGGTWERKLISRLVPDLLGTGGVR